MSAKFPRGDFNILGISYVNLLKTMSLPIYYQVTYVTASDIKKIVTNLQIYEYFYISKWIPINETY